MDNETKKTENALPDITGIFDGLDEEKSTAQVPSSGSSAPLPANDGGFDFSFLDSEKSDKPDNNAVKENKKTEGGQENTEKEEPTKLRSGAFRISERLKESKTVDAPVAFKPSSELKRPVTPDLDFKFSVTVNETIPERVIKQLDLKNYRMLCNPILNVKRSKITGFDFKLGIYDSQKKFFTNSEIAEAVKENPDILTRMNRISISEVFKISLSPTRPKYKMLIVALSPDYFLSKGFMSDISMILDNIGKTPPDVYFEFDEQVLFKNRALAQIRFKILKGLGIKVSIANMSRRFFSQLRIPDFDIDLIKIAGVLVKEYLRGKHAKDTIFSILAYAKLKKITLVAKGISSDKRLKAFYNLDIYFMMGKYMTFRKKRP